MPLTLLPKSILRHLEIALCLAITLLGEDKGIFCHQRQPVAHFSRFFQEKQVLIAVQEPLLCLKTLYLKRELALQRN